MVAQRTQDVQRRGLAAADNDLRAAAFHHWGRWDARPCSVPAGVQDLMCCRAWRQGLGFNGKAEAGGGGGADFVSCRVDASGKLGVEADWVRGDEAEVKEGPRGSLGRKHVPSSGSRQ